MKKKILFIIIPVLLIAVIVLSVVIALLLNKNKSVGSKWGDTYYAYLSEAVNEKDLDDAEEEYGIDLEIKNAKLQFCEVEENEAPAMIMTYEKNDSNYVNVYQITDDDKVTFIVYKQPTDVEFLYNIENEDYTWYIHKGNSSSDSYSSLNNIVKKLKENSKESDKSKNVNIAELEADYTISKEDSEITQETIDGEKLVITKFDSIFVKPNVELNGTIDFDIDISEKELKENISKAVSKYKTEDKIVTKDVNEEVMKKAEESKETIKKIADAKEAVAKKEEEEKNKGITVGNYTIKYGKYIGSEGAIGSTLVFKNDGTCDVTANFSGPNSSTRTFKYKVGTYNFSQDIEPDYCEGIGLFDNEDRLAFSFLVASNTRITDNDIGVYDYEDVATTTTTTNVADNTSKSPTDNSNSNSSDKTPSKPSTNNSTSKTYNVDDVYKNYLINKEYTKYTSNWASKPANYCQCDINKDGQNELLIASENDMGWQYVQICTYDKSSKKVVEVANVYAYGGLRYLEKDKQIIYTEVKPFQGCMGYGFYIMNNNKLVLAKTVGSDEINSYFVQEEGKSKQKITGEQSSAQFNGAIYFEYLNL